MTFLKALWAIINTPIQVARISPTLLHKDDVIVFECTDHLPSQRVAQLRALAAEVWPGRKIVIVDGGMSIKAMREADLLEPPPDEGIPHTYLTKSHGVYNLPPGTIIKNNTMRGNVGGIIIK